MLIGLLVRSPCRHVAIPLSLCRVYRSGCSATLDAELLVAGFEARLDHACVSASLRRNQRSSWSFASCPAAQRLPLRHARPHSRYAHGMSTHRVHANIGTRDHLPIRIHFPFGSSFGSVSRTQARPAVSSSVCSCPSLDTDDRDDGFKADSRYAAGNIFDTVCLCVVPCAMQRPRCVMPLSSRRSRVDAHT